MPALSLSLSLTLTLTRTLPPILPLSLTRWSQEVVGVRDVESGAWTDGGTLGKG